MKNFIFTIFLVTGVLIGQSVFAQDDYDLTRERPEVKVTTTTETQTDVKSEPAEKDLPDEVHIR